MSGKGERGKGGLHEETFNLSFINTELKLQTAAICYFSFFGGEKMIFNNPALSGLEAAL